MLEGVRIERGPSHGPRGPVVNEAGLDEMVLKSKQPIFARKCPFCERIVLGSKMWPVLQHAHGPCRERVRVSNSHVESGPLPLLSLFLFYFFLSDSFPFASVPFPAKKVTLPGSGDPRFLDI